jgi:hypothetical protein
MRSLRLDNAPGLGERHTVDERAGLDGPARLGARDGYDNVLLARCSREAPIIARSSSCNWRAMMLVLVLVLLPCGATAPACCTLLRVRFVETRESSPVRFRCWRIAGSESW